MCELKHCYVDTRTGTQKEKNMPFDFKKEYKALYLPETKPEIVTVPKANYIAVLKAFGGKMWLMAHCATCY